MNYQYIFQLSILFPYTMCHSRLFPTVAFIAFHWSKRIDDFLHFIRSIFHLPLFEAILLTSILWGTYSSSWTVILPFFIEEFSYIMIHESACLLVIALSVLHSSLWASVILLVSNRAQLSLEMNFRINYHEATVPSNHLTNATDTPDTPMASTRFTTHVASSPSAPEESYPSHRRGDDVTDNSRAPPSLTTALLPSSNRHPVALTGGSPGGAQGRYVRRHLRINSHSGTPNDTNSHPLENFDMEVEHEDMGRPLSPSSPASLTSPSSQPSSPTEDEFPPAIDLSESASTFNLSASRSSAQIFLSPLMTAGSVEDSVYLRLGMMSLSLLHVSESLLALYCDKNYVSQSML